MKTGRIRELLESWVNGNRKDVADELADASRADVVRFVRAMGPRVWLEDSSDVNTLITMLENRQA